MGEEGLEMEGTGEEVDEGPEGTGEEVELWRDSHTLSWNEHPSPCYSWIF